MLRKKLKSIFISDLEFKTELDMKNETPFLHLATIDKKEIKLSENDLKKQLLIIDERKNYDNNFSQIHLLEKIIKRRSPFVFFANSKMLFEQAKSTIVKNNTSAYIFKNKISFSCNKSQAFRIISTYSYPISNKKYINFKIDYNVFRDLFYKHTSSVFLFSVEETDILIDKLENEKHNVNHKYEIELLIDSLNSIKPILTQQYSSKQEDFENIFIQEKNNFLIYSEDQKFNEFFYAVFSVYYITRVSSNLEQKGIEDIFYRFPIFHPERRFFILPDLNIDFTDQKNNPILDYFLKIRHDFSNQLAFFILYTNKTNPENFTHSHIGNFYYILDDKNYFEQKIPKYKWE